MFDIETELKTLGAKKSSPDETLCPRTVEKLSRAQRTKATPRRVLVFRYASVAAVMLLVTILMVSNFSVSRQTSYFTIDINPSIGLEADANEVVLSVKAQNSDAEALLSNLDLTGMPFMDALRCVVQAAEEQGYLKKNGHVLVAHFGDPSQISEEQVEAVVVESTHRQVNVLLLQSDKSDFEDADKTDQSAGVSLLMRNAQQCGIEDADIETIIQTVKKNNRAVENNGSAHGQDSPSVAPAPSATPAATESGGQNNGNSNNPEKTSNDNKPEKTNNSDKPEKTNNGNNGNGQSDKAGKTSNNKDG